jgi:hypothetical protein
MSQKRDMGHPVLLGLLVPSGSLVYWGLVSSVGFGWFYQNG